MLFFIVCEVYAIDFSKHSAVGAYFRKRYIKTGVFDVSMSDIISEAFDIRSDSDYNDYFVISKKEVEEQVTNAQYFYDRVEEYVVATVDTGECDRLPVGSS